MKNKYILIFLVGISTYCNAQSRQYNASTPVQNVQAIQASNYRSETDTLGNSYLSETCADNLIIFTTNMGGYVNGNNGYGDKEKVQLIFLPSSGSAVCNEVLAFFGGKMLDGDGTVKAKVYNTDAAETPNALVGESDGIPVSACDTAGNFTAFEINSPVSFDNEFYAGIDFSNLYATGDSLGLISTDDGCGDGNQVYEKWGDDTWHPYVGAGSWNLNITLLVYGVVEFTPTSTAIDEPFATQNELTLYPPNPNPAVSSIQFNYALSENSNTTIEIYDAAGKLIYNGKIQSAVGNNNFTMDVSSWAAGKYYYSINTENTKLFSKFIVTK